MKFQKMDSKQASQAVVLGVLCVGVLGFGAYNLLGAGGRSGTPAAAAAAPVDPAPATPPVVTAAVPSVKGAAVPSRVNPDPFRPVTGTAKVEPGSPVAPPPVATGPVAARPPAPTLPPAGVAAPTVPEKPAAPAPPPPPVRPQVAVTGIIDAENGKDMALAAVGDEQRILTVGDRLPNNYRVKRIAKDGVLLVHKRDRFFVELGAQEALEAAAVPSKG